MSSPSLSVVIISHNQKEVLKRCIESILSQQTTFPVEIIVSDDRSSDGTRHMLEFEYGGKVISTFFNSDEYETSYILERAALNRINGLKLATGKYLIHIDGDDYFTGTDVFQVMVNKLESHPECTLCCQNYCILPYNNLNAPKIPQMNDSLFTKERILTGATFVAEVGIGPNSCFCMRRSSEVKIEDLTSTTYDDVDITLRYMSKGKIVLINKCDFVYVKYPGSSCSTITQREKYIMFNSYLLNIPLAPSLVGALLEKSIGSIAHISLEAIKPVCFPERLINYCQKFDILLLKRLKIKRDFSDKIYYSSILFLSGIMRVLPYRTRWMYNLLYKFIIKKEVSPDVVF